MAVKRFYFFGSYSSSRPFIMEVESDGNGVYVIQTTEGGYNYDVKTSDGQTFNGVTGNLAITFPSPNTRYDVEFSGLFPRIYFGNGSQRLKAKDIKQWGSDARGAVQDGAFYGCEDMECSALDSPNIEHITSAQRMFWSARKFNPVTFDLKFANLVNGEGMLAGCWDFNPQDFNPSLDNLENGIQFLSGLNTFNPPSFTPLLDKLKFGGLMFYNLALFNPSDFAPTLELLENAERMFENCSSFAQEIYAPNSVNLTDDRAMFNNTKIPKITMNNTALTTTNATAFNCPQLTDLILIDRKVDLRISYSPLLLGAKIDALANSVGDLTGFATKNVTMTIAQRASCDQTLWTNKNWTIIAV